MSKAVDPLSVPLDTVIKQKAKEKKAEKVKQTKAKNVGQKQGKRATQNKKSKPTNNNNNRKNNVDNLRKKKVKGGGGNKTPNAGAKQNNVPISKGKGIKKGQQKLARRQGGNTNNKGGGRYGSKVSMQKDNNAKRKQQSPRRRRQQHINPPAPLDRAKDEALTVTVQRDEPEPELSRALDTRKRKHVDIVEETDYSKEDIDLDRPPRAVKRVANSQDSREIAAEEDNFDAEEQLIVEELTQRFHRLQEVRAAKQRKVLSAVATRKFIDALAEETQEVRNVRRVVAPATNRTVASSSERERRFLLGTPLLKTK